MDALCSRFSLLGDSLPLYVAADGGVYCATPIPAGMIIGEVRGEPKYIWEIDHERFVIVDKEYVIDVSSEHSVVSRIREENATMNRANCTIVSVVGDSESGEASFFFQTVADIPEYTELVYYVIGHMYL